VRNETPETLLLLAILLTFFVLAVPRLPVMNWMGYARSLRY
jgi:hypothetical protein